MALLARMSLCATGITSPPFDDMHNASDRREVKSRASQRAQCIEMQ